MYLALVLKLIAWPFFMNVVQVLRPQRMTTGIPGCKCRHRGYANPLSLLACSLELCIHVSSTALLLPNPAARVS